MKIKNNYKKEIFKALSFALVSLLVLGTGFLVLEPNLTDAANDTDEVIVNLSVLSTISLDTPMDVDMSPDITGTGSSTGSVVWTVTTNNSAGWQLEVNAGANPAMASGGDTFANYTEGTPETPEAWSIANNVSEFGFGATGSYIETKFGADKYMGFVGVNKTQVSHAHAETAGDATTIIFKAEVGSAKSQPTGDYSATITATATTL